MPTPAPTPQPNKTIGTSTGDPGTSNTNTGTGGIGASAQVNGNGTTTTPFPKEGSDTEKAMCNLDGTIKDREIPNCTPSDQTAGEQTLGPTLVDGVTNRFGNTTNDKDKDDSVLPPWVTNKNVDTTESVTKQSNPKSDANPDKDVNADRTKPGSGYASKTIGAVRRGYGSPRIVPVDNNKTKNTSPGNDTSDKDSGSSNKDRSVKRRSSKNGAPRSGHQTKTDTSDKVSPEVKKNIEAQVEYLTADLFAQIDYDNSSKSAPKKHSYHRSIAIRHLPAFPNEDASPDERANHEKLLQENSTYRYEYNRWKEMQDDYELAKKRYDTAINNIVSAGSLTEQQKRDLEAGKDITGTGADAITPARMRYLKTLIKLIDAGGNNNNGSAVTSANNLDEYTKKNPAIKQIVGSSLYIISSEQVVDSGGTRGSIDNIPAGLRKLLEQKMVPRNDYDDHYSNDPDIPMLTHYEKVTSVLGSTDQRYRNSSDIDRLLMERAADLSNIINVRNGTMKESPDGLTNRNLPVMRHPYEYQSALNQMLIVGGSDNRSVIKLWSSKDDYIKTIEPLLNHPWIGQDAPTNNSKLVQDHKEWMLDKRRELQRQRITLRKSEMELEKETDPNAIDRLEESISNQNRKVENLQMVLGNQPDPSKIKVADRNLGVNIVISQLRERSGDLDTQKAVNNFVHRSSDLQKSGNTPKWTENAGVTQSLAMAMDPYWRDLATRRGLRYPAVTHFYDTPTYTRFTSLFFSDPVAGATVTNSFFRHQQEIAYDYGLSKGKTNDGMVSGRLHNVLFDASKEAFNEDIQKRTYDTATSLGAKSLALDIGLGGSAAALSILHPLAGIPVYMSVPIVKSGLVGSDNPIAADPNKSAAINRIEADDYPNKNRISMALGLGDGDPSIKTRKETRESWKIVANPKGDIDKRVNAATELLNAAKISPTQRLAGAIDSFDDAVRKGREHAAIQPSQSSGDYFTYPNKEEKKPGS